MVATPKHTSLRDEGGLGEIFADLGDFLVPDLEFERWLRFMG
jgi:hypothetical protein